MRDAISQLKALKHEKAVGAVSGSERETARAKLMEAIGQAPATPRAGFAYAEYYRWSFAQLVSMPMTVGAAMFVLAFGGWMTSVNAAQALPGDTLYSVKIATERAQLRLASLEHKAVLHTEFAERRLVEAVAIKDSEDPVRQAHYKSTIEAFKQQVTLAEGDLKRMQQEGNAQTSTIASKIDTQIDRLSNTIDEQPTIPHGAELTEAIDVAREVSNAAVNVIVEQHETVETAASTHDVQTVFKKDLTDIYTRQARAFGRLNVIKNALTRRTDIVVTDLTVLETQITQATKEMGEAQNTAAAGGYRAAFAILREAEADLLLAERRMTDIEILVTTAPMVPEVVPETESIKLIE